MTGQPVRQRPLPPPPRPEAHAPAPAPPRPILRERLGRADIRYGPYAMVLPFYLLFTVFGLFPLVYTLWVSLHRWNLIGGTREFTGLDNYSKLLADPHFWNALGNTLSIAALSTVPMLILSLLLAAVLNSALRGRTFWRMGILVPYITSVTAVAIIFTQIFDRDYGLLNYLLGLFGFEPVYWQAGTLTSHIAIAVMVTWHWAGYNALIYLAAMQSIPQDLYEAAAIDGAGAFRRMISITIPMLRPTIMLTVIMSTIGSMQLFAEPLLFEPASQQPGGSDRQFQTVALYLYEEAFRDFRFGYASAIAWALFLVIMLISLVNYLLVHRIRTAEH